MNGDAGDPADGPPRAGADAPARHPATGPRPRRGPLVALLVAHYASACGNAVTVVTVPLYVLAHTGSPVATGLAAFAGTAPLIFAGALGGVWVDRLGGRTVSVLSDVSAGVLIAVVPLLDSTVGLPVSVLMVLLFLRTIVATPASAARITLLTPVAATARVRLETVNSWYQAAPRLGLLAGAPLAALLVAATGAATGMYADAASFLIAAVLVAVGVPGRTPATVTRSAAGATGPAGFLRQLADGAGALRRIPVIAALTGFVFVTNFLDDAFIPVLMPVYAREIVHDPGYLGWFVAASGCGAVFGTYAYAPASRRLLANRRATMFGCFVASGALRLSMAAAPRAGVMILLCLLLGIAAGPLNPVLTTVMLEHVPAQLRGRVFGLGSAVALSGAPLGVLAAGWGITGAGLRWTLAAFGGTYLLLVAVSLPWRVLRAMDDPPAAAAAADGTRPGGEVHGGPAAARSPDAAGGAPVNQ